MPNIELYLLGENSSGATQVASGQGTSFEVLHDYGFLSRFHAAGLAAVRFDPADGNLPWRRGDILVALSSTHFNPDLASRRIDRLRPNLRRGGYDVVTIWSDNVRAPIRSLALDNAGTLYFSVEGARNIWRLTATGPILKTRRPPYRVSPWATLPRDFDWAGDFTFAPDGSVVVSSGIGARAASLLKFDIASDPPPASRLTVARNRASLFNAQGVTRGLCFYAPDRAVFVDGYEALSTTVDPSVDPSDPPPSGVPGRPSEVWEQSGFFARDVDVARVEWEDFIQERPALQTAISWSTHTGVRPYSSWESAPETSEHRRILNRMYGWVASGKTAPLTYLTEVDEFGNPRIGPAVERWSRISDSDAAEIYLAHLGVQLWVAVKERTPWGIDSYTTEELDLIFSGRQLFIPSEDGDPNKYEVAPYGAHGVMPDEPISAYRFFSGEPTLRDGDSFIQASRTETIYAFCRWMRDNLRHGPSVEQDQTTGTYGYAGLPPLKINYIRTEYPLQKPPNDWIKWPYPRQLVSGPRYWSYGGCHSTIGMMICLFRLALIPVRLLPLYEWPPSSLATAYHGGVDFPSERLAAAHTDDFYAITDLLDFHVEPEAIFNGGPQGDYQQYISHPMFHPPTVPADAAAGMAAYDVLVAKSVCVGAAWPIMNRFWTDMTAAPVIEGTPCKEAYSRCIQWLTTRGVSQAEAESLVCSMIPTYRGIFDTFIADNAAELAQYPTELLRQIEARVLYENAIFQWWEQR